MSDVAGVGPALSALIERLHRFTPGGEWWDQMVEQPWGEWVRFKDVEAALSGSVGGLNAAPLEPLCELVEELVGWWHLNRDGSVNRTYDYLDKMTKKLRDALPASPVCAAEKK